MMGRKPAGLAGRSHRHAMRLALPGALLAIVASAQAQTAGGVAKIEVGDLGKWSGPYQLPISPYLREIAHASVLPYEVERVILWCRTDACDAAGNLRPTETYVWNPDDPGTVSPPMLVPNGPESDFFCAGTTFDSDGNLIVVAGHDAVRECAGAPFGISSYGTLATFRLPYDKSVPPEQLSWQRNGNLTRHRWYPTAIALADASIFVAGHAGDPPGTNPVTAELFDRWTPAAGWGSTLLPNRILATTGSPCSTSNLVITDYPRMFVLAHSGEVMIASGVNSLTAFLKPNAANCSDYSWRWKVNANPGSPMLAREGGPAAHFVIPDPVVQNVVHDTVYVFGGAVHDDACMPAPFITATVDKMKDPTVASVWDQTAPDMKYARSDSNAVVLLDGSVLVIGGYSDDPNGACASRLVPELFRPPELFPANSGWQTLASQKHERRYHSVAGLLPDGRVFSAGGSTPFESHHSIEMFSPPYLFKGQRPQILAVSTNDWSWNHPVKIVLTTAPGATIVRAALLRPGSITHAFDMNTRYIELQISEVAPGVFSQVTFKSPRDWNAAPPGYYFLTAIDSVGRPSPARVVRIH